MARPRTKNVVLSNEERAELQRIAAARTESASHIQRARILLMVEDGRTNSQIKEACGASPEVINKTLDRYKTFGAIAALDDLARPGRPAEISDEDKAWIIDLACQSPKSLGYGPEKWTYSVLTKHIKTHCEEQGHPALSKIAPSKVWSVLDDDDIKPHRIRYYLTRRDENFEERMRDVLILYKKIAIEIETDQHDGTITVSYDEKPGMQVISNVDEDLPPRKGAGFVARDYEYKRKGTVSLLAGLNLVNGHVTHIIRDSHSSQDFIEFLEKMMSEYPEAERFRIVLDNHSVHRSKKTMEFVKGCGKEIEFIFTPKHGSWLNLIESFFGKLSRCCLSGMRVKDRMELERRIDLFIKSVNEDPVIYHWTYKMDEIEV
jgi:transposase